MSRLNNKGQSLAIFVIFVPVFIMMGTYVVDVSFAKYNERRLDNLNKQVINYGLKHIDEEPYDNMVDLIYQNDSDIDFYEININNETKEISVTLSKSTKGFFGSIVGKEIYNEKSSLKGYIKDDKKIIESLKFQGFQGLFSN